MNIEKLCAEANSRVAHHINRSAGQHLRALRPSAPDAPSSSDIYAMCCESSLADKHVKWLCSAAGVAYPPINQGETA